MNKKKKKLNVNIGGVIVGGDNPVVIQSMTDTITANIPETVKQIISLYEAGSQIVRVTVNDIYAARSIPLIKDQLASKGLNIPLVGCLHYNGHKLLKEVPDCAKSLDKYRINPGNVGFKQKKDTNFATIIELAMKYCKPIRIGGNWGSIDQELLQKNIKLNLYRKNPKRYGAILQDTLVQSVLNSATQAEKLGLSRDKIILSAKVSKVQDLISVYKKLHIKTNYPLHIGLTEAGTGLKASVATTAALSILLQSGIGDTIRASLTPKPGYNKILEVKLCQNILQSLGMRNFRPTITSCPGCGRTDNSRFQKLLLDIESHVNKRIDNWIIKNPEIKNLEIAVMGCIVNGPGESKHADIGISLPGLTLREKAVVYIDGIKKYVIEEDIRDKFLSILDEYVIKRYKLS